MISPELIAEWDYKRNSKDPLALSATSHYEAHWICSRGHSYQMRVEWRNRDCGCYYCSGKKPIEGETDFATLAPNLLLEWDFSRNEIQPHKIALNSRKSIWWLCNQKHSWKMRVDARTGQKQGCPFCSGQRVLPGETDLPTTHPEIAAQWHAAKNLKLPIQVSAGSGYKAWWTCPLDSSHEWQAPVLDRKNGQGCPQCAKSGMSQIERYFYRKLLTATEISSLSRGALDLRWPSSGRFVKPDMHGFAGKSKFAVEYDGWYFHRGRESHDRLKTQLLLDAGYVVLRIREHSAKGGLALLNISHPNLIQVEHFWDRQGSDLDATLKQCHQLLLAADKRLRAQRSVL